MKNLNESDEAQIRQGMKFRERREQREEEELEELTQKILHFPTYHRVHLTNQQTEGEKGRHN